MSWRTTNCSMVIDGYDSYDMETKTNETRSMMTKT